MYDGSNEDFSVPLSDTVSFYKLIAGYQLNSAYAIEFGLSRTDDVKEHFAAFIPPAGQLVTLDLADKMDVKSARFYAFAPFERISVFGAFGYFEGDVDSEVQLGLPGGALIETSTREEGGLTVSGGIQIEWDRLAVRGEYEWFDMSKGVDAETFNAVLLFRF